MKLPLPALALLADPSQAAMRISQRADCSAITCVSSGPGVAHIVVNRASTEAQGTGVLGSVANAVVEACPGSDIVANPYPAVLSPYVESEQAGVGNLTESACSFIFFCLLVLVPLSYWVRVAVRLEQQQLSLGNDLEEAYC